MKLVEKFKATWYEKTGEQRKQLGQVDKVDIVTTHSAGFRDTYAEAVQDIAGLADEELFVQGQVDKFFVKAD